MALVVRRDGHRMSSDTECIHPFFRLEERKVIITTPLSLIQSTTEEVSQHPQALKTIELAPSVEEVVVQHDNGLCSLNSENDTRSMSSSRGSKSPTTESNVLQDTCDGGNLVTKPNESAVNDGKSRRKRRKLDTTGPSYNSTQGTLPWRQPPTIAVKDESNTEEISLEGGQKSAHVMPLNVDSSTLARKVSPGLKKQLQLPALTGDNDKAVTGSVVPRKKIMKLRKDGKLFSPPKKAAVLDPAKRGRNSDTGRSNRLVVFKYGDTAESRREIGEKIEQILKGELRIRAQDKNGQRGRTENIKAGVPKNHETHPFFLAQRKIEEHKHRLPVPVQSETNASRHTSPSRPPAKTTEKQPATFLFGTSAVKATFPPESQEPLWPPEGMSHVRDAPLSVSSTFSASHISFAKTERKAKDPEVFLKAKDEVWDYLRLLANDSGLARQVQADGNAFKSPDRRIVLRSEIQTLVFNILKAGPRHSVNDTKCDTDLSSSTYSCATAAAQKLFDTLSSASSAFDSFKCESQEWVVKYAPKSSTEVLQSQEFIQLLKGWLAGSSVHSTKSHINTASPRKKGKAVKKRKQASELDDFIIDSDDDDTAGYQDEWTHSKPDMTGYTFDKQALRRNDGPLKRFAAQNLSETKAVVVSGPNGCGKTAAIYAIAQELGFEIFEINAGSRRSGRDILEKVGDMTQNHLVSHLSMDSEDGQGSVSGHPPDQDETRQEIASGKQSTMQSFFKKNPPPKVAKGKPQRVNTPTSHKPKQAPQTNKASRSQKQSLILLEEIDVLFEEDKQFWSTVVSLIATSKRPVIMTCNDESLLPSEVLEDCSLVRFSSPAKAQVVEYLLLMAAHEGHLLNQEAVSTLYTQTGFDLRASIMQLNFWCQMAVRDDMGGLGWILFPQDYRDDEIPVTERRVMSEGTFLTHMGTLGNNPSCSMTIMDKHTRWLCDAALEWDVHVEDLSTLDNNSHEQISGTSNQDYEDLRLCSQMYDSLSAAEVLQNAVFSDETKTDNHFPCASELRRLSNFTIDPPILQTRADADMLSCEPSIIVTIDYLAQSVARGAYGQPTPLFGYDHLCDRVAHRRKPMSAHHEFIAETLQTALDPLIDHWSQSAQIVTTDLAPYIRTIVSYDSRLEQERARLNKLLSDGTRSGKRQRTTRASRAALEGGHKASTRRERWFECELNFPLLLETGGSEWQNIAWEQYQKATRKLRWARQVEYSESEDELCS